LKNQKSKFEHIFPNPNSKTFLLLRNHRSKATAFAPRLYCFGKMWSFSGTPSQRQTFSRTKTV